MNFEKIRKARKALGMTQYDLATALNVNRATISKYESGQIEPSISQLKKIADILNVSWYELYSESKIEQASAIRADVRARFIYEKLKGKFKIKEPGRELRDVTYSDYFDMLKESDGRKTEYISLFDKLNIRGQREAVKRVEELTRLDEYGQKDELSPFPNKVQVYGDGPVGSFPPAQQPPQMTLDSTEGKDTPTGPDGSEGPQKGE